MVMWDSFLCIYRMLLIFVIGTQRMYDEIDREWCEMFPESIMNSGGWTKYARLSIFCVREFYYK